MKDHDLVRAILARARDANPQSAREWRVLELEVRSQWGGESHYVAKASREGKVLRLADCLAAGLPLNEAREKIGVSRRTCFRLLKRPWVIDF